MLDYCLAMIRQRECGFFAGIIATIVFTSSCNIYKPLDFGKSDEAHLEEALKCYHDQDYDCAVAEFEKISDSNKKNEKLCTAYLAQAGLTLTVLLNTLNQSSATMLGEVATALLPWTEAKGTGASNAKTACLKFATSGTSNNVKTLLSSVAYLVDCSSRMSKADTLGDGGLSCSASHTAVTSDKVTDGDIDFMCDEDVNACKTDISKIGDGALGGAGLSTLESAFDSIPAELTNNSSQTAAVLRSAIKTAVKDS